MNPSGYQPFVDNDEELPVRIISRSQPPQTISPSTPIPNSTSAISDAELAKKLQDIEFNERKKALQKQAEEDERIARELAASFRMQDNATSRSFPPVPPTSSNLSVPPLPNVGNMNSIPATPMTTMRIGDRFSVRLHHPATKNYIGEVFNAIYLDSTTMVFELFSNPSRRLRCANDGSIEFSEANDGTTRFTVTVLASGPILLGCVAHKHKDWHLALMPDGRLRGDASKGPESHWVLIAAQGSSQLGATMPSPHLSQRISGAPYSSLASSSSSSSTSSSIPPSLSATSSASVVDFPGFESSSDKQIQWLQTSQGQAFLSSLPSNIPKMMFDTGTLHRILHRYDWPYSASRIEKIPLCLPAYNDATANAAMPPSLQASFFENGFCVLPNIVSQEAVSRALRIATYWAGIKAEQATRTLEASGANVVELKGAISQDPDIIALFSTSALPHVIQMLIGVDEVSFPHSAVVSFVYPSLFMEEETLLPDVSSSSLVNSTVGNREFKHHQRRLTSTSWYVDGFTNTGEHSPYTLTVGVALGDMIAENCGNFCAHPGSQMLLQEAIKDEVRRKSTVFSSKSRMSGDSNVPDLGPPTQLILKKGDVFLCSQKCAIQRSPNETSNPAIMAIFQIKHIDHEVMKVPALDGCWVEFVRAEAFGVHGGGTPLSPTRGMISPLPPPQTQMLADSTISSAFNSGFDSTDGGGQPSMPISGSATMPQETANNIFHL